MDSENDKYVPALSYEFLTPLYDPVVALSIREKTFKTQLLRQIEQRLGMRVLDLGCGTATLTIALKKSNPQAGIFGLDGDPRILGFARRKIEKTGLKIALSAGLSNEMPYADSFFEAVASSLFFHHLAPESKLRTLAETFRVLKAGGTLHVADWGKPNNLLMKIASQPVQWLDGAMTRDSYAGKLPVLMAEAGFTNITETASFDTVFGTLRLHKAGKR